MNIKIQFRIEESRFYYFILFFLSTILVKNYDISKIKNIIKLRETLMLKKTFIMRKKLLSYYNLFFHRYIREKTLKSISNPFNKKLPKKKIKGNLLSYFLIRHQKRLKHAQRIPRLKNLH
jgi:hypothetical protein